MVYLRLNDAVHGNRCRLADKSPKMDNIYAEMD